MYDLHNILCCLAINIYTTNVIISRRHLRLTDESDWMHNLSHNHAKLAFCMQHHTWVHFCLQCVRRVEFCPLSWTSAHSTCNLEVEFLLSASFQENWHPRPSVLRIMAFTPCPAFGDMGWLHSSRQGRKLLQPVCFHRKAHTHTQIQAGHSVGSMAL